MSPVPVFAIAATLMRRSRRDAGAVAMFVVVPIVAALVFGLADQRANDSLPIGIVQSSEAPLASSLVQQLRDEPELRITMFDDRESMHEALRRGDIFATVVVPPAYDENVATGVSAPLEISGDESQSTYVAGRAAVTLVVDREQQALNVARRLAADRDVALVAALPEAHTIVAARPATIERRTASRQTSATGVSRSVAGMLTFFVFTIAMGRAITMAGDQRSGVLARAATIGTRNREIIAGEILGRFLIALLQGMIIVLVSALLLDVRWGNPVGVFAIVALFAAVAASASVVVGCRVSGTEEQSIWATDALMAVLGVIGGCFFALRLLPDWARYAGHIAPHAWAIDGFDRLIATNAGVSAIVWPLVVLAAMAFMLFLLAVRDLRRSFQR